MKSLSESLLELIRKTSTELPNDIIRSIEENRQLEKPGSQARYALDIISENIALAKKKSQPICQDTGSILFYVHMPLGFDQKKFSDTAKDCVAEATAKGYLRQNSVDSITGKNSGNNLGAGSPTFHFVQHDVYDKNEVEIRLILKGGGCENVGAQYSLPNRTLGADRNLTGVRKCILDSVVCAQGKGCAPGVLGICIGGDRSSGYAHSKEQLLRMLDDKNQDPKLAELEENVVKTSNKLGIGPMGFGGHTTLLGCKIASLNRLPASYFVSISYMCWAYRRQGVQLHRDGMIAKWLY